jgi:anti-anti-sigma factor
MTERDTSVVMSTSHGDGVRLVLAGRVDATSCERLAALLDDVRAPGAEVRVDLSRVERLPTAALRCVLATTVRLRETGGRLVVEHPSPSALRLLRTSGLHRVLEVEGWPLRAPLRRDDAAGA